MPSVITVADVRDFFRESLADVRRRQRLTVQPDTEWYLVELLAKGGVTVETTLAELLAAAIGSAGHERAEYLKQLADGALYAAGYFSDSLLRSGTSPQYYAAMGSRAYEALAGMPSVHRMKHVYAEISHKFQRLVDLLAEMYESTEVRRSDGLMKLYERYLRTNSERLYWKLQQEGLMQPGSGRLN